MIIARYPHGKRPPVTMNPRFGIEMDFYISYELNQGEG
jgi:hypothetical protein